MSEPKEPKKFGKANRKWWLGTCTDQICKIGRKRLIGEEKLLL